MKITAGKIAVISCGLKQKPFQNEQSNASGILMLVSSEISLVVDGFKMDISIPRSLSNENEVKIIDLINSGKFVREIEI